MSWVRSLLSVVWLVAFVASTCMPAASATTVVEPGTVVMVAAEPCPATHLVKRCDVKALPTGIVQPEAGGSFLVMAPGTSRSGRHGVWPDVEPDPPRV